MSFTKSITLGLALTCAAQFAIADTYPSKPIKLVVPFAAGSPTDALARILARALGPRLKQTVIIDNKPGATGMIGTDSVAKSEADGYTLVFATNTTQAANSALFKKLPYDPLKDFTAIAVVGGVPHALVVHPALPVNTVPELIQYAKANPGQVSFPYANSTTRITGATFGVMTKTQLLDVAYKSYPQAVTDLLGGQTKMMFIDFTTGLSHIKAGKLKVLAITPDRSPKLPNVPAMSEVLPGFTIANWNGIFAPRDTPEQVVKLLHKEITAVLTMPDVKKQIDDIGYELVKQMSPTEFNKFVEAEHKHFAELVKAAGIQPE